MKAASIAWFWMTLCSNSLTTSTVADSVPTVGGVALGCRNKRALLTGVLIDTLVRVLWRTVKNQGSMVFGSRRPRGSKALGDPTATHRAVDDQGSRRFMRLCRADNSSRDELFIYRDANWLT